MPHLSRRKLKPRTLKKLDAYLLSFLTGTGARTRERLFRELFTKTERLMVAKRLLVVHFLTEGLPVRTVSRRLAISSSTVRRFAKASARNEFRYTARWLRRGEAGKYMVAYLVRLLSVPFEAQHKSLAAMMDD